MFRLIQYSLVFMAILMMACKSDFERVRTSGDAAQMAVTAKELYANGDYNKAIILYELIIPAYRGKSEAETLNYEFADAHFKNSNFILSSHYFKTFADTYTSSPKREEALFLSALSEYKQSPRYKLDQSNSSKAIDAFQLFVNSYPNSDKVKDSNKYMDELRKKMEIKAFENGKLYYHLRNYSSAIQSLQNMLKDYPESEQAEEALYLIAKASKEWSDNSYFVFQQERYNETIKRCELFMKKYPRSEYAENINNYKQKCQEALNKFKNG